MIFFKFIILFSILVNFRVVKSKNNEVCYEDYGCFDINPPFGGINVRPLVYLPEPPSEINTKFTLYTRANQSGEEITLKELSSNFNPKYSTKFILHGYRHNSRKKWVLNMVKSFLRIDNFNVITVDYYGKFIVYELSVSNARIIGLRVARLIQNFVSELGANLNDFHLIGHSLGAHVAGYAGDKLNGQLGRITGLDPAGHLFEFTDNKVKLDSSDAKFVDIIHTDGLPIYQTGLGISEPIGHVDFYPNGGYDQPNCAKAALKFISAAINIITANEDGLENFSGCSHVSAIRFFTDSIENKNCSYFAFPCESKEEFDKGNCKRCSDKGCNKMGYWASPLRDFGSLYLTTQNADSPPYCQHSYLIHIFSDDLVNMKQIRGRLTISLKNSQTHITNVLLDDHRIRANSTFPYLFSSNLSLNGKIESVTLLFNNTFKYWRYYYDSEWSFKHIDVFDPNQQEIKRFCPVKSIFKYDEIIEFLLCN